MKCINRVMKWIAWKRVVKNWNGKEGESVIGILASGLGNDNGDQTNWQRSENIDNSNFTNSKNKTVNFTKFVCTQLLYNRYSSHILVYIIYIYSIYKIYKTHFSRHWVNGIEQKGSHQGKIKKRIKVYKNTFSQIT